MSKNDFDNEISYYFVKKLLNEIKSECLINDNEYELAKSKIKGKYEPYFDLISE